MTLQNRVLPTGEIVAIPARGTLMGNRGILHDDAQRLTPRRWQHHAWVTCLLRYKNWHRDVMQPRNYTELFFLDEPTALATGHRPCGLCRPGDYRHFKTCFNTAHATRTIAEIDRLMQRDRITRTRTQIRHSAPLPGLPDGTMILHDKAPHLVWDGQLMRYTPEGYIASCARPHGETTVLTPAATVAALAAGYRATPHASAKHLA